MPLTGLRAAVLAGGLGTRLRSVTGERPKVLAEVADRPFLEHLLIGLRSAGLEEVVLCTGFGASAVEQVIGDGARFGLRLFYSPEGEPRGTGGALRNAAAFLGDGPALVLNGDSLVRCNLAALVACHRRSAALATLLLARVADCGRFGAVGLDARGRIARFEEKGVSGPGLVNAGVYVVERALWERIPADWSVSLEREVFPALAGSLQGQVVDATLLDIGTPESLAAARRSWREGAWP